VGLHWGPAGVAVAWTASFWILTLPAFWYAGVPVEFGVAPMLAVVWKFVVASALAGCATALILREIPDVLAGPGRIETIARIGMISVILMILYVVTVIVLHGGCGPIYQIGRLVREISPPGRFSKVSPVTAAACPTTPSEELSLTDPKGS